MNTLSIIDAIQIDVKRMIAVVIHRDNMASVRNEILEVISPLGYDDKMKISLEDYLPRMVICDRQHTVFGWVSIRTTPVVFIRNWRTYHKRRNDSSYKWPRLPKNY